uniref:HNH endonuclease signature motif containing protein n=1 Tax=uncultured Halomonas sp. TaxID=173971 RepID=UPI0034375DFC
MRRQSKYTQVRLAPLVANAKSWAKLLHSLDLKPTGGNYRHIQSMVRHHGLPTEHFTGRGWRTGQTKHTNEIIRAQSQRAAYRPEDVFIENFSGASQTKVLRRLMIEEGFEYRCANGHPPFWMERPLTLHIDHINGVNNDNRRENLRFLCPNCHQQTRTWGKSKS